MRTIPPFTKLMAVVFFFSLLVIGCKKENSSTLTPAQEEQAATYSSQSETESEFVFNDVFDNVMGTNTEVGVGGTGIFGKTTSGISGRGSQADSVSHCFTVTVTRLNPPNLFPVKIVIDFGNGCLGNDGHTRYGKIITVYTGRLIVPGKSATTTFDGFKIDDISVSGKHVITNTTNNTAGSNQLQYTVDVTNARLSKPNGDYSEWESHRVITQVEGNGSILPVDDVFTITGSSHGKVKHGNDLFAWHSEITEPLRKRFTCRWISKGTIKVIRETLSSTSRWVAILDYGSGNCDNQATLTINGVSHQITLH